MIKAGNGPRGCKIPNVCHAISNIWLARDRLVKVCQEDCRLEALWDELIKFPHLGGFMSYEVICDLRYTGLLENATDVDTWANPGPGCARGLLRLEGKAPGLREDGKPRRIVSVQDELSKMRDLLAVVRKRLSEMPRFELREVEHSLCEFDKYERALFQDGGRMKRRYNGSH